jgi:hypothetical protein
MSLLFHCRRMASRSLKSIAIETREGAETMRNKLCIAIMLAALAPFAANAQKANLSGTWRLNLAKSFMGMEHPFSNYQLTKTIKQSGDTITITDASIHNSNVNIPLPDSTTTMQVATDGKAHEIQVQSGNGQQKPPAMHVTATWQGDTLELVQIVSGLANMSKHRLFLSADGSQLIELVEGHSMWGDSQQRLVFDKLP